ncbi:MAG: hypothetical protein ABIS06_17795 [Vicinamibacterales bacterium]
MQTIAEQYVRLVLAVGLHDPDYVDSYYGPAEWKPSTKAGLDELRVRTQSLQEELKKVSSGSESLESLRHNYLIQQLTAVAFRISMLSGTSFPFDQESRYLYDATAPTQPESHFNEVLAELEKRFPGKDPLVERYDAFRRPFVIPKERLDQVFQTAIAACRERTARNITLPEGESFTVEYVTNKSWSGYNWYQGGFKSLIQVNTDLPIYIDRAVDLACHEGYPGHHVYNALLEQHLVKDRGWVEFTVYPLFSPQSLIAEGTANYGIQVAFPGDQRVQYEQQVLFPAAGIDPSRAREYYEVQALVDKLAYAGNEAARRYLNKEIDAAQAAAFLEKYALMTHDRAAQRVRFFDQYRSYVINYNLGKDMVRDYVEKRAAGEPARRWQEFAALLSSPRLPSGLR